MSTASKIAVSVASGYLLGRTKKLKLAITVGSMLAGQRIATSPQGLLKQGSELLEKNPELQKLQEQITGKLFEAAKAAAMTTATSRLESFSKSLTDAGSKGEQVKGEVVGEGEPDDEAEYDEEGEESEEGEEPEAEYEEGRGRARGVRGGRGAGGRVRGGRRGVRGGRGAGGRVTRTRARTSYDEDEGEDEGEEESEGRGGRRRARRTSTTTRGEEGRGGGRGGRTSTRTRARTSPRGGSEEESEPEADDEPEDESDEEPEG